MSTPVHTYSHNMRNVKKFKEKNKFLENCMQYFFNFHFYKTCTGMTHNKKKIVKMVVCSHRNFTFRFLQFKKFNHGDLMCVLEAIFLVIFFLITVTNTWVWDVHMCTYGDQKHWISWIWWQVALSCRIWKVGSKVQFSCRGSLQMQYALLNTNPSLRTLGIRFLCHTVLVSCHLDTS